MDKRKKKRKLKKTPIFLCCIILVLLLCSLIQIFFTPKWFDGNTQNISTAENGVHTQEKTEFNEDEVTKIIEIVNT